MFAERDRGLADGERRLGEAHERRVEAEGTNAAVQRLGLVKPARQGMSVVERARSFEHRGGGDAYPLKQMKEGVVVERGCPGLEMRVDGVMRRQPAGVGVEGRLHRPGRVPHEPAQQLPLFAGGDGEGDPAVSAVFRWAHAEARVDTRRGDVEDRTIAAAFEHFAVQGVLHERLGEHR